MLDANAQTFTTFPFMAHKISNVNVNTLINSMTLIKEIVKLVHVNPFALIGRALVERSLMIIRLFPRINKPNRQKVKLFIIRWEG